MKLKKITPLTWYIIAMILVGALMLLTFLYLLIIGLVYLITVIK